jgi:hypothetical protein
MEKGIERVIDNHSVPRKVKHPACVCVCVCVCVKERDNEEREEKTKKERKHKHNNQSAKLLFRSFHPLVLLWWEMSLSLFSLPFSLGVCLCMRVSISRSNVKRTNNRRKNTLKNITIC